MKKSSAIRAVFGLKLFAVLIILAFAADAFAQGQQHYRSPLYSPRKYDPNQPGTSNGLPKALDNIGIEQRLGEQLPLETEFKNEDGEIVKLGDYFNNGRPVIIALVYYECPMLCNEVLNGLTGSIKGMSFNVGKEFDIVAISFDARENDKPGLARNKKEGYMGRYGRQGAEKGWHFLTGTQDSIDKVTEAVGFNYRWDEETDQFAHAGGVQIATPEGKLARYFYGIDYAPRDLKFGIMESAESKVGNPVEQLMLYCFHYNPATGKYGLIVMNVVRLAAIATLIGLAGMFFIFWRYNKRRNLK